MKQVALQYAMITFWSILTLLNPLSTSALEDASTTTLPAGFDVTPNRGTDSVEIAVSNDTAYFTVRSPAGISRAVIQRSAKAWPRVVNLRLHLQGLESFQATNGKVTLHAAVSSPNDKPRVRLWKDGMEQTPLDAASPFWMEIRLVGSDGKPTAKLPLKNGYFELQLPQAFFAGNPKSITLAWIDFYRH